MGAIKESIITNSGMIFTKIFFARNRKVADKRAAKQAPTVEQVEKINRRNSLKGMTIKVHHNFSQGDHWLTLTYEGDEPTKEYAQKEIKRFIDRIRRKRKASGKTFKWILVTEYENKRSHHHILINDADDIQDIVSSWQERNGLVRDTLLDGTGDYRKLCEYMHKETSKTFRDEDSPSKLRYTCSRNLVMPKVYREEVSALEVFKDPKPEKGYSVDPDSVYRAENPFTGRPYIEYVLKPTAKPRKRYNNKKKTKYKNRLYTAWLREHKEIQTEFNFDSPF